MTLRTPNPYNNRRTMVDLQRTKERSANLQEQLSSGRRLTRLSEDPTAAALVIDFKNSVQRNQQYIKTVQSANSMLRTSETALSGLDTSIVRLMELGVQGLSGTTGAAGRTNIASEVDGLRTNLMILANTRSEGKFIFAGTRTTTQPFSGPAAGPITYAGDNNLIQVDVAIGGVVTTNLPGDRVFFGTGGQGSATDMFQVVTDLRDALLSNNLPQLQAAYDRLKPIQQHISDMMTEVGGRQAALTELEDNLGQFNLSLQSIQGTYEDLNYPEAITEYQRLSTVQQVSLSALARSGKQSLFDFIG